MVNLEDIVITREDESGSDSYDLTNLKKNSGTEKVKSSENSVVKKNGGKRPGSGRKKILERQEVLQMMEEIKFHGLKVDAKTKKTRIMLILDKLYELGMNKNNVRAIQEYLNRQLGQANESITFAGDKDNPVEVKINSEQTIRLAEEILNRDKNDN
jgi:hypothetical protein